ncbi:MAG: hypothetical protein U0804_10995 [Gemmataceae bacterium]
MEPPAAVRQRFGASEDGFAAEAEGRPARAAQLRVRSFNFGQYWRTPEVREVSYSVTVPLAFVTHLLARELPEYIKDWIACPETGTLEDALRRRQWPAAEQIFDDPELCPLALNWFAHDCLIEWLGDGEPQESPGYVINTVERAERQETAVQFAGTARAVGQPVRYQDV